MKKFTIGAERHPEALGNCLAQAGATLGELGIEVRGEQLQRGRYTFYTYRVLGTRRGEVDDVTDQVIQVLADAVAEYVTTVWEQAELRQIVANDFYYYAEDEVDYLAASSVQMLGEIRDGDGRPLRRLHIADHAAAQIALGGELLIEGLLRFRLAHLREDLHRIVEQAIDEYLMDLEYQEFVKLLRYFLDAQEPGLALLHMVCHDEQDVQLYKEDGKRIDYEDLPQGEGLLVQNQGVKVEDLMSTLIALAPEKLHVHVSTCLKTPPPVVETVQKVFQDRAVLCAGCPLDQTAALWGLGAQDNV